MSNLLLHNGTTEVTRDELTAVVTPEPTPTWTPIPHVELLDAVTREVTASGLIIQSQSLALSNPSGAVIGARFFGLMEIHGNSGDYGMVIGIRNSHDQRFNAGLCVGSHVFVCSNLAFSAEIVVSRRHTSQIRRDLPRLINDAAGRLGDLRDQQGRRIEAYRNAPLSDVQFHDLAIRALDAGVVPVTKLPKVLSEYREPQHEEFLPRTVWSGFNAFTEALKTSNLYQLPKRTQALHGLCDMASRLS